MKVLVLSNYAEGLHLFRREVLEAIVSDGHELLISIPEDKGNYLKDFKTVETPLERRGMNPIKDFSLLSFYIKLIKAERPDVVLTYTIKPNIYGGIACRWTKTPYIENITGLGTAIQSGGILASALITLYRYATKKARKVFFQNEGNRRFMQDFGVAATNSDLLPGSGVNLTDHPYEEYPSEEDGLRFLSVIRIMKDKGIDELLEAAELVSQSDTKAKFIIAGDYEEETRAQYEPRINELEERGIVTYLGHRDDIPKVMADSHVIIHPSYHEGLSNVLLEAAACGRPVLASDIPGCKETFVEGVSGLGFEAKNAMSLVDAIRRMQSFDEIKRRDMGQAGRHHVQQNFDREIVVEKYREELKKI